MVPSIGQLLINRIASPDQGTWRTTWLGTLPAIGLVGGIIWQNLEIRRRRNLTSRAVFVTLLLLGVAIFSFVAALALMVLKTQAIYATLAELSPLLSLAAGATVVTGLTLRERRHTAAVVRTTGDALALFGAFLLLLCVYLAWPQPSLLIAVGAINAALLGSLAISSSLPLLLAPATLCGTLATLIGIRVWRGELSFLQTSSTRDLINSLVAGMTGVDLTVIAGLVALVGLLFYRRARIQDAYALWGSCGAIAVACLFITFKVGFFGGPGRELSAPVLAFYAVITLVAATRLTHPAASIFGSGLLLTAIAQALIFNPYVRVWLVSHDYVIHRPYALTLLLHANIVAIFAVVVGRAAAWTNDERPRTGAWRAFVIPIGISALITTACALPDVVWVREMPFGFTCGTRFRPPPFGLRLDCYSHRESSFRSSKFGPLFPLVWLQPISVNATESGEVIGSIGNMRLPRWRQFQLLA